MIIDSHQHFWKYNPEEYSWIGDSMKKIRRDFLPQDLMEIFSETGVEASVAVQARLTLEETSWLLELASESDIVTGVVGWVPLTDINVSKHLDRFSIFEHLKGIRHVIHDEPDGFILRDDFNEGIAQLREYDLVYDILIFEQHLEDSITFVDRHPNQVFVLDHIGKPDVKSGLSEHWRKYINELAKRDNVFCKISGIVTEADHDNWTRAQILPYMEIVTEAFWPERIMYGSDWPVVTVAAEYDEWLDLVLQFLDSFSGDERQQVLSDTAKQVYQL